VTLSKTASADFPSSIQHATHFPPGPSSVHTGGAVDPITQAPQGPSSGSSDPDLVLPIITGATCRFPPSISTDSPSPIHSKAINSCANPTYPPSSPPSSSPLLSPSDNYDIAEIGSITIVDDTIESPELQLAPKDSDKALQWDK
jgi:hypothetical protein